MIYRIMLLEGLPADQSK